MSFNIYNEFFKARKYYDKAVCANYEEWIEKVRLSRTVYVGNLSVYTTEREIYEHMSKAGPIETVIMGLNRVEKGPCGFCFVVYESQKSSAIAVNILDESILDGRVIKVDEDIGIIGERRYGRGVTGAQRIDERAERFDFDRPIVIDNLYHTNILGNHIKSTKHRESLHTTGSIKHTGLYRNRFNKNNNSINNLNMITNDNDKNSDSSINENQNIDTIHTNDTQLIDDNDDVENAFSRHQIENNYNDTDTININNDSADKKHERFKAFQKGNRMRVNLYANNKDEVNPMKSDKTNIYEK